MLPGAWPNTQHRSNGVGLVAGASSPRQEHSPLAHRLPVQPRHQPPDTHRQVTSLLCCPLPLEKSQPCSQDPVKFQLYQAMVKQHNISAKSISLPEIRSKVPNKGKVLAKFFVIYNGLGRTASSRVSSAVPQRKDQDSCFCYPSHPEAQLLPDGAMPLFPAMSLHEPEKRPQDGGHEKPSFCAQETATRLAALLNWKNGVRVSHWHEQTSPGTGTDLGREVT
ncbi:hypothetical protein MC885_003483 [Smutsia gigantea]|nr:hypothetical protein MC885_003483 [Smutsia gigantea]